MHPAAESIEVAVFLLVIGVISALFVSLPYVLLMWRFTNTQRVVMFSGISGYLLVLSTQFLELEHLSLVGFMRDVWPSCFLALMLGWFVCGFIHVAVVSLRALLGSGSHAAPAQD